MKPPWRLQEKSHLELNPRIFQIQAELFCFSMHLDTTSPPGIELKYMENKKIKTLINFKKAQSLIVKISSMVEKNEYCIDIMQQNLAVIGLLKSAHQMLMENHLNTCFKTAMASTNEKRKQEMTDEILKVAKIFNK